MINLFDLDINLGFALKNHREYCYYYAQRKLGLSVEKHISLFSQPNKLNSNSEIFKKLNILSFLEQNYKQIIDSEPKDLVDINEVFEFEVDNVYGENACRNYFRASKEEDKKAQGAIHNLFVQIQKIFDYDKFKKLQPKDYYSSYHLAQDLSVRSCTYCNRVYTATKSNREGGKMMIPQLDHWLPKNRYPLLKISFYNLIPSCSTCNSTVKSADVLDLDRYCHPYIKELKEDSITFKYLFNNSLDEYHIFLSKNYDDSGKLLATANKMRISEMYEAHQSELKDLISIKEKNTKVYLEKLSELFPTSKFTEEDVYRIAFGTEKLEKNFHLRPMSKFKHDILKDLDFTA